MTKKLRIKLNKIKRDVTRDVVGARLDNLSYRQDWTILDVAELYHCFMLSFPTKGTVYTSTVALTLDLMRESIDMFYQPDGEEITEWERVAVRMLRDTSRFVNLDAIKIARDRLTKKSMRCPREIHQRPKRPRPRRRVRNGNPRPTNPTRVTLQTRDWMERQIQKGKEINT